MDHRKRTAIPKGDFRQGASNDRPDLSPNPQPEDYHQRPKAVQTPTGPPGHGAPKRPDPASVNPTRDPYMERYQNDPRKNPQNNPNQPNPSPNTNPNPNPNPKPGKTTPADEPDQTPDREGERWESPKPPYKSPF